MNTLYVWLLRAVLKNTTLILFVLLFIAFGALSPSFLTARNFEIILSNASYIGIIAVGMTCVLLTGGIDLSVGSVMYASAVVVGLLIDNADVPTPIALAAGLLVGLAFGLFNALVVAVMGVPPFIATLVTMNGCRGSRAVADPIRRRRLP
jgi:ribose transport system permease protein